MDVKDLTILLVDDDAKDLAGLEQSVEPLGFNVIKTDNPQDVMPRVESDRPALVILDALLPGISGFDLCKRIKTQPEFADTLVIIITGVYLKDQYRRDALQSFQADGFVTKPCRPVELQRVVLGLLAKKLGTTPRSLGARLKRGKEDLPIVEPEDVPGWWSKLWKRVKGKGVEPSLTITKHTQGLDEVLEEEERGAEDVLEEAPEVAAEVSPEAEKEEGEQDEEMKLAESVPEDSPSESEEDEPESTEGTIRLGPGSPLVSEPERPVKQDEGVEQEMGAGPPAAPPVDSKQALQERTIPRPEAIHRGVPIYGEEDFLFELGREVARCQRLGRPLTLILIRVTDLEQIVELVGSGFKRQLLWHVAEQALESLRQVDLAGHLTSQELVGLIAFGSGRYGGRRIVTRVQRAIKRHPFSVGEGLPAIVPALRFGIAVFPKEGEDLDALMDHARRELAP